MAATNFDIKEVQRYKIGNAFVNLVIIEFANDFTYATGGIEVEPKQMGVTVVKNLSGVASSGHYAKYDKDNEKIVFFVDGNSEVAGDNTALQEKTAILTVIGQ